VLRRDNRDQVGATAVEFAFVMLPLIYLVFGIIQYGLYFYAMQTGTSAVSSAARRLSVGDCQVATDLRAFLKDNLGAATTQPAASLTTTVVYKNAAGLVVTAPGQVGGSVQLTLSYPSVNMNFPLIPLPNGGVVTRTVFARVEDINAQAGGCPA
jgi:Flp pilus assembly protein TadG